MSSRSSGGQNDNNNKKKAAATKKSTNKNNINNQNKNKRSGSNNDTIITNAAATKSAATVAVGTNGNSKNKTSTTSGTATTTGDAAKTLLVLARQDSTMADRQQLLRTMIQIGVASPAVIQEVYNMSPSSLTLDVLFEAGKLQASAPVKKLLLRQFGEKFTKQYHYPNNILRNQSFVLRRDPNLLTTSGNVCLGLQLVLQTNIGILKAYAPTLPPPQDKTTTTTSTTTNAPPPPPLLSQIDKKSWTIRATKPIWNLQEFSTDFLNEVIKSNNLQTLQFTFPKEPGNIPTTKTAKAAAVDKENQLPKDGNNNNNNTSTVVVVVKQENKESSSKQQQQQPQQQQPQQQQKQQQQKQQQQVQVQQTKVRTIADKIKDKLTRKKLENCTTLQDVRIQFDYSHKTCESFLQLATSLATNLPNLQTFAIQVQKSAEKPKDFQQFKAALSQSIGKIILPPPPLSKNNKNKNKNNTRSNNNTASARTGGLQTLVVDAADLTKDSDWEPLLKALEKNPPLQRLLIRGFTLPKDKFVQALLQKEQQAKATKKTTRINNNNNNNSGSHCSILTKEQAQHICLESFKHKLLTVIQNHNTNLREVRFVVPGCICDGYVVADRRFRSNDRFVFDSDHCWFRTLTGNIIYDKTCSPMLSPDYDQQNGQRIIPPPQHVPELYHYLQVNSINNGSSRRILMNPNNNKSNDNGQLTHKQFATALVDNINQYVKRFIDDPSILYTLLRGHTEYIPMLLSSPQQQFLSTPQSSNSRNRGGGHHHHHEQRHDEGGSGLSLNMDTEMEELYLAAAGKLALPLERFIDLCLRRSDEFTSLYNLLRIFPTIWLSDLRPAKAIIQEQSKRTRKEYVSVVVQHDRTQIYKMKKAPGATTTPDVASYGARVVQTLDCSLKLIRLNVAPSVGGATLTKFPKVAIGKNGKVVFAVKKKQAPASTTVNNGTSTDLQQQTTIRNAETTTKTATATSAAAPPPPKRKKANLKKDQGGTAASKAAATTTAASNNNNNNNKPVKPKRKAPAAGSAAISSTSKAARLVVGGNNNKTKRKNLLKIEGLDDIKFDDDDVIVCDDDHDDDDYYAPSDDDDDVATAAAGQGRRPRPRRRSVAAARRKVVTRRGLGNDRESLSELIGESSSSEDEGAEGQTNNETKGGGDDSDYWDAEAEEEEEESDWDMDDDEA